MRRTAHATPSEIDWFYIQGFKITLPHRLKL